MSLQALKIVREEVERECQALLTSSIKDAPSLINTLNVTTLLLRNLEARILIRIEKECIEICPACNGEQEEHVNFCKDKEVV